MGRIRKKSILLIMICIFTLFLFTDKTYATEINKSFPDKTQVALTKDWTVKLNNEIDPATVAKAVTVVNETGQNISVKVVVDKDNKTIHINHPDSGYEVNKTYFITIQTSLKSKYGHTLKQVVKLKFTTVSKETVALTNLSTKLGEALVAVKTDTEKALVAEIKSIVDLKLAGNDVGIIDTELYKQKYGELTSEEKSDFMNVMLNTYNSISEDEKNILMQIFL